MTNFIEVTAIDSNGSGLQFQTLVNVDEIEAVIDVSSITIPGVNAKTSIKCRNNDESAYLAESYKVIKGKLRLLSNMI